MNEELIQNNNLEENINSNEELITPIVEITEEITPISGVVVSTKGEVKQEEGIKELESEIEREFEAKQDDISLVEPAGSTFEAGPEHLSVIGENPLEVAIRVKNGDEYLAAFYMTIDDEGKTYGDESLTKEEVGKKINEAKSAIEYFEDQKKRYGGISNKTLYKVIHLFSTYKTDEHREGDTEQVKEAEVGISRLKTRIKYLNNKLLA